MTYLSITQNDRSITLHSINHWNIYHLKAINKELRELLKKINNGSIVWDVSGVESFDSAGVILFAQYYRTLKQKHTVEIIGYNDKQKRMYALSLNSITKTPLSPSKPPIPSIVSAKPHSKVSKKAKNFWSFLGKQLWLLGNPLHRLAKYASKR